MITVVFPHRVPVTREGRKPKKREPGLRMGDNWYILWNKSEDAVQNSDSNFDVGSLNSGLKLDGGYTFEEARRIALAMEDSGMVEESDDEDIIWIAEAIIGSALADHYVFPIDRYMHLLNQT